MLRYFRLILIKTLTRNRSMLVLPSSQIPPHIQARSHKSSLAYKDKHTHTHITLSWCIILLDILKLKMFVVMCHIQRNGLKSHHRSTALIFAWLDFASIHHTLNFESNFLNMMRVYMNTCIYFPRKTAFLLTSTSFPFHLITSHLLNKRKSFTVWQNAWKKVHKLTQISGGMEKWRPFHSHTRTRTHFFKKKEIKPKRQKNTFVVDLGFETTHTFLTAFFWIFIGKISAVRFTITSKRNMYTWTITALKLMTTTRNWIQSL